MPKAPCARDHQRLSLQDIGASTNWPLVELDRASSWQIRDSQLLNDNTLTLIALMLCISNPVFA